MSITLNGTTGISTPDITSTTAPSLVGTNFTSLPSASLTGALPAIDGSALTGVGASTTYGAVGTYAYLSNIAAGTVAGGTTFAGSGLYPAAITHDDFTAGASTFAYYQLGKGPTAMGGTWRLMGYASYRRHISVYVRIS